MRNRWKAAKNLEAFEALVYASRTIGEEPNLVLWGGGNSSVKMLARDHLGRDVRVLWVKGSGSDMRTITAKQFTPLRLDELLHLLDRGHMTDEEMVAYQNRCVMDSSAPRPSIETLLHAFLPSPHIYHTHADAICTLTDTSDSSKMIQKVYGHDVVLVPYVRPGFELAKLVADAYRDHPQLRAIILDKHGLVTWGNSSKDAYTETIKMVSEAEQFIRKNNAPSPKLSRAVRARGRHSHPPIVASQISPVLRGALSKNQRVTLMYDNSESTLRFVNNPRAQVFSQIGPFTPDHLLHTKAKPLFLELPRTRDPESINHSIRSAVEQYRKEYVRYFEQYKTRGITMLDPYPRVILIPGLGMFTTGKDRRAARITHDLYHHTMQVICNAAAVDSYTSLSPRDLHEFEYWPLENFKLTLLPPEKRLSRRIALVTGAAGTIGRAIASQLVSQGASVVLTDINEARLRKLADELNKASGEENTMPVAMDVSDELDVIRGFEQAVRAYGGLDIVVSNAGIARSAAVDCLSLRDWSECIAVNATGHFLVCREAMRIFKAQQIGGNIVVVATKNVVAPGKHFGAYSASKAAQAQLARVLAIEGGESGVRVNMVNPDGIFDGSGIWSDAIRQSRAKAYGIPVTELEGFCIQRNLLKVKITADDVADVVVFLASDASAKTTGAMIPVDGGIKEAFAR